MPGPDGYLHINDVVPDTYASVGPVAASALQGSAGAQAGVVLLEHRPPPVAGISMRLPLESRKAEFKAAMTGLDVEDDAAHPFWKRGYHLQMRVRTGGVYPCGGCTIKVKVLNLVVTFNNFSVVPPEFPVVATTMQYTDSFPGPGTFSGLRGYFSPTVFALFNPIGGVGGVQTGFSQYSKFFLTCRGSAIGRPTNIGFNLLEIRQITVGHAMPDPPDIQTGDQVVTIEHYPVAGSTCAPLLLNYDQQHFLSLVPGFKTAVVTPG